MAPDRVHISQLVEVFYRICRSSHEGGNEHSSSVEAHQSQVGSIQGEHQGESEEEACFCSLQAPERLAEDNRGNLEEE